MVRTIGILGAGRVGSAVARTALRAGYDVNIAGSGAGSDIELLVDIVVPGARAMSAADAVADSDLVIVAVPLHKYRTVSPSILAGKIVIDTINYWAPIDGRLNDFDIDVRSSSEIIRDYFPGARVVKTLNHIGYHELETDGLPAGSEHRRALGVAGDDAAAVTVVMDIIDRLGFDPVHAGSLQTGAAFQPGTAIFGGRHSADELQEELSRSADTPSLSGAERG
ncbi:NADPH-dependent F420 reductase [Salinibacterium sp. ZJ450]|uniref:NADPH-dependent F420 reductase n=1 Tax=Salinibacterium sp. ZJ450 TaxID=2708338 RepID=UPI00142059A9|nr:NADPH-dependent F420 reductase [Salinibacterium sp. ZJ450]